MADVKPKYEPRYSGPNRTGICVCGCRWDDHHLGIVMNQAYYEATKESYVPQECEAFGFHEASGMKHESGEWVDHCQGYRDQGEKHGKVHRNQENNQQIRSRG